MLGKSEVGYIEKASNSNLDSKTGNKGSSNYTKYSRDINALGLLGCQGQPWCCTFQFWLDVKIYGLDTALKYWNMTKKTYTGYNCFSTYNAFKKAGKVGKSPKLGAVVIFTFSHAGRVIDVYKKNGVTYFDCLEGNTSANLNDRNGGQVVVKTRIGSDSTVKGFCYIDYESDERDLSIEYPLGNSREGLCVTTSELNIRDYPKMGTVVGSYKQGDHIYPIAKVFIGNEVWFKTHKGYVSGKYMDGWIQELSDSANRWWKVEPGYTYQKSAWIQYNGDFYYVDQEGWMVTGCYVKSIDKDLYYWINGCGVWEPQWNTDSPDLVRYVLEV